MIHIRIQAASWPTPFDVFYTHAQDISTGDGVSTLYRQIHNMSVFIGTHGLPRIRSSSWATSIYPRAVPQHYAKLLNRGSAAVRDCWTLLGNSGESGLRW